MAWSNQKMLRLDKRKSLFLMMCSITPYLLKQLYILNCNSSQLNQHLRSHCYDDFTALYKSTHEMAKWMEVRLVIISVVQSLKREKNHNCETMWFVIILLNINFNLVLCCYWDDKWCFTLWITAWPISLVCHVTVTCNCCWYTARN